MAGLRTGSRARSWRRRSARPCPARRPSSASADLHSSQGARARVRSAAGSEARLGRLPDDNRVLRRAPARQRRHRHHGSRHVRGEERHRAAVQPGLAEPHAADPGGAGRAGRHARRCAAAARAGGRDHQDRRRARRHRPARVSRRRFPLAAQFGLHPQLAQLEMLVNPTVETLLRRRRAWPTPARSRSFRSSSRSRCSSGARAASCRCGSPTSRSPKKRSIRTSIPIRAKVSLGHARAERRRPRLRASGRPHVHELSHQQGAAGVAGDVGRASRVLGLGGLP